MNIHKAKRKAIFLDRDGTLIEEVNFLSRLEDLRFFDYTNEAIRLLKESGFLIIVVTNQSGIRREIFAESAMHDIHEKIQSDLNKNLDAFYFCPHLPTDGCACRKPNLGMIEAACANFDIDLENSWMIGDKAIDVETGFNAGIKTALVLTGYGQKAVKELKRKPDLIAENLIKAVKQIVIPNIEYQTIYDLYKDIHTIKLIQNATTNTKDYGLHSDFGLFGSEEWWKAIENKQIEVHTVKGIISKIYNGGHNDFPQFEVDDGSEKTQWERRGDETAYVIGKPIRIKFVLSRCRLRGYPISKFSESVIKIDIGKN